MQPFWDFPYEYSSKQVSLRVRVPVLSDILGIALPWKHTLRTNGLVKEFKSPHRDWYSACNRLFTLTSSLQWIEIMVTWRLCGSSVNAFLCYFFFYLNGRNLNDIWQSPNCQMFLNDSCILKHNWCVVSSFPSCGPSHSSSQLPLVSALVSSCLIVLPCPVSYFYSHVHEALYPALLLFFTLK